MSEVKIPFTDGCVCEAVRYECSAAPIITFRWIFFVSDAQPWDEMDPGIPKYELYPPLPTA